MASLSIPEPVIVGLVRILSLEERLFSQLLSALQDSAPILYSHDVSAVLAPKVSDIPLGHLKELTGALFSLSAARVGSEVPITSFLEDIAQALEENRSTVFSSSDEERERFKLRLLELLETNFVKIGTKAVNLLFENSQNLTGSRIVTDIRPIFGDQIDQPPVGAIIVHKLKLIYRQGNRQKEFFIAMDNTDITKLIDTLQRANSKAEALRLVLQEAHIPYIGETR